MTVPSGPSRSFPQTAWAWPSGALDQLLCAAICPDTAAAAGAFGDWLEQHDIDGVGFREHRLLAAIAERFGKTLAERPEYGRLLGLQRHLWTRSRLATADTLPVLRTLSAAGVTPMLLKGGARIAADAGEQRARVSHDLDILVAPADFVRALDTLFDAGWSASSGESRLCMKARAGSIRAMNFFGGRFGDIDLHQWAYGAPGSAAAALEMSLWQNACPATYFGVSVLIPAATDRMALAILHGGFDAHAHSDWLVDCAVLIGEGAIDWPAFQATVAAWDALVPAQVALSYLSQRLGVAVPEPVLARLLADRSTPWPNRISALLQAKPRADWGPISWLARGAAKQLRLAQARGNAVLPAPIRGRFRAAAGAAAAAEPVMVARLLDLQTTPPGRFRFQLDLVVTMLGVPRRLEFELNTETRHLARLSLRSLRPRRGPVEIRFRGEITLLAGDFGLWLEARPGRHLRGNEPADEAARYAALGFSLGAFICESLPAPGSATRPEARGQ